MAADTPIDTSTDIPFNMQKGVDELSDSLGLGKAAAPEGDPDNNSPDNDNPENDEVELDDDTTPVPDQDEDETQPTEGEEKDKEGQQAITREPPKAWPREKHEVWSKLTPEAQDIIKTREEQFVDGITEYKELATFGKELKDVITPYEPVIREAGLTHGQAMQYLMNAHVRLSYGSLDQRKAAYEELGRNIGVLQTDPNAPKPDPAISRLEQELGYVKQTLTAQQQAEMQRSHDKIRSEVDTFANDPKNQYFDEVAEDIAILIKGGLSLEQSYERAIWANPVTRLKEQQRLQTEQEKAAKVKAKGEAEKARKASSSNVNSRDTKHAPTGPEGKMFDDMPEILAEIKQRDVH